MQAYISSSSSSRVHGPAVRTFQQPFRTAFGPLLPPAHSCSTRRHVTTLRSVITCTATSKPAHNGGIKQANGSRSDSGLGQSAKSSSHNTKKGTSTSNAGRRRPGGGSITGSSDSRARGDNSSGSSSSSSSGGGGSSGGSTAKLRGGGGSPSAAGSSSSRPSAHRTRQQSNAAAVQKSSRRNDGRSFGNAKPPGSAGRRQGTAAAAATVQDDSSGSWRLFNLKVPADQDPGKDDISIHPALQAVIAKRLACSPAAVEALATLRAVQMLRKSFDSRRDAKRGIMDKQFVYIVEVSCAGLKAAEISQQRLTPKEAWLERGPAGLFAALEMAQAGIKVVLLERGQPVEQRGRDLGAFFVRGVLNADSNLCYGEGGAGTWSDGKLTTRIGRNSEPVRRVLQSFVQYGAPESILVAGKPHLGTERLVRLLKAFRLDLQSLGVDIRFVTTVRDIKVQGGRCCGVGLADGSKIEASAVVLAVGHSARALYKVLQDNGVTLKAKSFAMGFRIEHPQSLIDTIRYGAKDAAGVMRGKGRIPVADYTLAATVLDSLDTQVARTSKGSSRQQHIAASVAANPGVVLLSSGSSSGGCCDAGVAAAGSNQAAGERGVYSFCMCPGGQIVCTSTNENELCINGMSFSRRNSAWANSAMVVSLQPHDWQHLEAEHGALAGMALQVQYERLGAQMGGGKFVAPVQRATDFLDGVESRGVLPSSSYRLGVRSGPLHEMYEGHMTAALRRALGQFERRLPGFVGPEALLHGVETRTSAPVQIVRREDSLESVSLEGLYPCGEGAGYAGGIVSAAVDGLRVGEAVVARMLADVL